MTPEQRKQLIKDYCYAAVMDLTVNELCEFVIEFMIDGFSETSDADLIKQVKANYPEIFEEDDDDDDDADVGSVVIKSKPAPTAKSAPPWAPKGFKNQQ